MKQAHMRTLFFLLLISLLPVRVFASEAFFGYLYTTETTPGGNWEYEQTQTLRSGKARGSYTGLDMRNEFEYGVSGNFQAAFYVNSSYIDARNQYNPDDVSEDLP